MTGLLRLAHAHRAARCAAAMGKRKGHGSRLYAVRLGRSVGVYDTWRACSKQVGRPAPVGRAAAGLAPLLRCATLRRSTRACLRAPRVPGGPRPQVLGYSGAQYKSFETAAEAQFYLEGCPTLSAAAWRRHAACAPPAAAAWCSGAAAARRCTEGDQAPAAEACAPPPPAAWCPEPAPGARATGDPCSLVEPSRRYRLVRPLARRWRPGLVGATGAADRRRMRRQEWDGGARGNPGPAGAGAVLYEAGSGGEVGAPARRLRAWPTVCGARTGWPGAQVGRVCVTLGHATNNVAEYHGLLAGLQAALDLGVRRLDVQGDSMLVVNQARRCRAPAARAGCRAARCRPAVRARPPPSAAPRAQVLGTWQCRHPGLQPLHARAVELTQAFDDLTIAHMPRWAWGRAGCLRQACGRLRPP
jgi:ribonuclease HI